MNKANGKGYWSKEDSQSSFQLKHKNNLVKVQYIIENKQTEIL